MTASRTAGQSARGADRPPSSWASRAVAAARIRSWSAGSAAKRAQYPCSTVG